MDIRTEMPQRTQPPLEAYQLVMQYSMGGLIAEYKKRARTPDEKQIIRITLPLLILLYPGMLGVFAFLIWTSISDPSFLQFPFTSFTHFLLSVFCILLFLLLYGWFPVIFYRNYNSGMLHCTEGLIYRRGKRVIVMRWHEIDSISESIWNSLDKAQSQACTCTLRLRGRSYVFNGKLENARELGRIIEREITRRRIIPCWQRITQGEKLRFGPLCISEEGMYKGSKLVRWDQISQVHIFRGVIAVAKDGVPQKWPLVGVARIPNFFLFVALVHQLTDGRVSYQPLEFEFGDYGLALLMWVLRGKARKEME